MFITGEREVVVGKCILPQVTVGTNFHKALSQDILHAGSRRNNELITARLTMQGSLQVSGSQLESGMSRARLFFPPD